MAQFLGQRCMSEQEIVYKCTSKTYCHHKTLDTFTTNTQHLTKVIFIFMNVLSVAYGRQQSLLAILWYSDNNSTPRKILPSTFTALSSITPHLASTRNRPSSKLNLPGIVFWDTFLERHCKTSTLTPAFLFLSLLLI